MILVILMTMVKIIIIRYCLCKVSKLVQFILASYADVQTIFKYYQLDQHSCI